MPANNQSTRRPASRTASSISRPPARPTARSAAPLPAKSGGGCGRVLLTVLIVLAILAVAAYLGWRFFLAGWVHKEEAKLLDRGVTALTGGKVKLDTVGGKFTLKDQNGNAISLSATLPTDWPKDVPIYPGAKVKGGLEHQTTMDGLFVASADIHTVTSFYAAQLPANGWQASADNQPPDPSGAQTATYTKDTRTLTVLISPAEQGSGAGGAGSTAINLTVAPTSSGQ